MGKTPSSIVLVAQSAWTVEYTDCISAKALDSPNECPGYDTKQSDSDDPVMLELWRMWSAPLLPSLSGLLPAQSVGAIEYTDYTSTER